MKTIVYYDGSDGSYVSSSYCQDDAEANPDLELPYIEVQHTDSDDFLDMSGYYVDLDTLTLKPRIDMPLTYFPATKHVPADGSTEISVEGIPAGTLVSGDLPEGQVSATVDDGVIELASYTPGTGSLNFVSNRYNSVWGVEVYFD